MFDRNPVTEQVIENCNISDARYAGLYSICGLALRLRDLYKWEKGLEPWVERSSPEILEWIGEKEEAWERLVECNFKDIVIDGTERGWIVQANHPVGQEDALVEKHANGDYHTFNRKIKHTLWRQAMGEAAAKFSPTKDVAALKALFLKNRFCKCLMKATDSYQPTRSFTT